MDKRIPPKRIGTDNRVSHTESVRRVTTKNAADLVLCLNSTDARGIIEMKPGGSCFNSCELVPLASDNGT
jgi:sulfur relay (sulfurtransferase) complex TusBCD TusD component (DsrE family)